MVFVFPNALGISSGVFLQKLKKTAGLKENSFPPPLFQTLLNLLYILHVQSQLWASFSLHL